MAWLEKNSSNQYRIVFRINGRKVKRSLRTKNAKQAQIRLDRIEETIKLVDSGRLTVPESVDFVSFVLSDGKLATPLEQPKLLTIKQLEVTFLGNLPLGNLEDNTLAAMVIHLNHLKRILGQSAQIASIGTNELQTYVNRRSRENGRRGKFVSTKTIKMELASFRSMWNWGRATKRIQLPFPNSGLRYPKTEDRPPFRTREQIENQLAKSADGLEKSEMWECLFLYEDEVAEILTLVAENSRQPFLKPMCAVAAYTGARRGELLRSRYEDIDLDRGVISIRERKRIKSNRSIRSVPIADCLHKLLLAWLDEHPGGPWTFCLSGGRSQQKQLTESQSNHYLTSALEQTRWHVLHGWHTFRHSFVSACASRGIDQRIIDSWVGHQTEEMRRRYRHLFPEVEKKAIHQVFA